MVITMLIWLILYYNNDENNLGVVSEVLTLFYVQF